MGDEFTAKFCSVIHEIRNQKGLTRLDEDQFKQYCENFKYTSQLFCVSKIRIFNENKVHDEDQNIVLLLEKFLNETQEIMGRKKPNISFDDVKIFNFLFNASVQFVKMISVECCLEKQVQFLLKVIEEWVQMEKERNTIEEKKEIDVIEFNYDTPTNVTFPDSDYQFDAPISIENFKLRCLTRQAELLLKEINDCTSSMFMFDRIRKWEEILFNLVASMTQSPSDEFSEILLKIEEALKEKNKIHFL